ncbi:MAG: Flp family type IVb pilin [Proteobacteria bacterium]|nr:Flp family type IVb pilin [Pseudomonadota bacterium]
MSVIRRLFVDQRAVTAVEYGLILGMITLVVVATVTNVGRSIVNALAPIINLT